MNKAISAFSSNLSYQYAYGMEVVKISTILTIGLIDIVNYTYRVGARGRVQHVYHTLHTCSILCPFSYQENNRNRLNKDKIRDFFFNNV